MGILYPFVFGVIRLESYDTYENNSRMKLEWIFKYLKMYRFAYD